MASNFLRNLVGPQVDENGNPIDDNGNPISVNPPADQADPQYEPNPTFTGPGLNDPNRGNILNTDNPTPLGGPSSDATSEEMVRELTPEPAPKIEPRDRSGHDDILRQIAELNAKRSPWMEQNQGIYKAQAGLQSLLGEEDRASEQDYQGRLQEASMYGKNATNQQKVDAQRYGYDTRFNAALLGANARTDVANTQGDTRRDVANIYGETRRDVTGTQGDTARAVAGINAGAHTGAAQIAADASIYRTDSAGSAKSAVPKLPPSTQKALNDIVSDSTLSDQEIGVKANQLLSGLAPLPDGSRLRWSYRDKAPVRVGGGAKGTVPSMTSAPVGQDATIQPSTAQSAPAPVAGNGAGPQEGDIQKKGTAMRIFKNGTWEPYVG